MVTATIERHKPIPRKQLKISTVRNIGAILTVLPSLRKKANHEARRDEQHATQYQNIVAVCPRSDRRLPAGAHKRDSIALGRWQPGHLGEIHARRADAKRSGVGTCGSESSGLRTLAVEHGLGDIVQSAGFETGGHLDRHRDAPGIHPDAVVAQQPCKDPRHPLLSVQDSETGRQDAYI